MTRLLCLLVLGVFLGGCGYHPEGYTSAGVTPAPLLYLELARNKTGRAFIENALSNQMVERFGRSSRFRVTEERSQAELLFSVDIVSYGSGAIAYDRSDTIRLYRCSISAIGTMTRNSDGRILWKGTVVESAEYAANDDRAVQQANENMLIDQLSERLADDLYARAVDDF